MRLLPNFLRKLLGKLTQEDNVRFWEEFYKIPQESRYPKHWSSMTSNHHCQFCMKKLHHKTKKVTKYWNAIGKTSMCPNCVESIKKIYSKHGK